MISVIIRNRNEAEYIGFAIQSVIDFIPKAEIIVIDNNSTDESLGIVKSFNYRIPIKVVNIKNYTPGKSLNLGIEHTKRSNILILSAHAQITKFDLGKVETQLKEYGAVFGKQVPIYKGKRITPRYIWSNFGNKETINPYSENEGRFFLHNAFCFYPKSIFSLFEFDESLPGKEDRYFAQKIIDGGHNILYDPSIEVNHFYTKNGSTWKGIG